MTKFFDYTVCTGNIEIWDQTVGCPTCEKELWNYPGKPEDMSIEDYEDLFFLEHPFAFGRAHDPGDEDAAAWDPEIPIGGYKASYNRSRYGNDLSKWIR